MNRMPILCLCLASWFCAMPAQAAVVLITQSAALAGNVTPGDAPGFPVTLSASGSYRLDSNLALSTAVNGIEVMAAEVTIDFNGFKISGGDVANNGVVGFQRGLTVRNGTIRAFNKNALKMSGPFLVVDNMRIVDNNGFGIYEDQFSSTVGYATVKNSVLSGNDYGIICAKSCRVENNIVSDNSTTGVYIFGSGGLILGNAIFSNTQFGIALTLTNTRTGIGNNTIVENGTAAVGGSGSYIPLHPNACFPQAC
jgi:parallel beta-helix repeat protein